MAIKIERDSEQRCRAIVDGSMTIYEAAADKSTLLEALARAKETDIDLSSVREMDTAGLQLLVLAKREALKHGKVVRLTGHSPASLDVIERYGLAAYFGHGAGSGDGRGKPVTAASRAPKKRRSRAKAAQGKTRK